LVSSSKKNSQERIPKTSLTLGAHIIWGGRVYLFEKIQKIQEIFPTSEVYMSNTDSVVISVPKKADLSKLKINTTENGSFKHQISDSQEILKFCALSPVSYHFTYKNHVDELKQLNKVAGFNVTTLISKNFSSDKFEHLIDSVVNCKEESIELEQVRGQKLMLFQLRNNLIKSRKICQDFTLKPFGSI
jgi:hypothetical protein